ncbi:MAG: uncharacterized protein JWN07_1, partial [Hyphomicrobiales bacterium]|nr:uncharacterized protein [Hyphomicrobiales bacterium]
MTRSRAIPLVALWLFSAPAFAQSCAGSLAPVGAVAQVRERLEIELVDGRWLALAGLAPFGSSRAGAARFEAARAALESRLSGANLSAPTPLPLEDRWGRITGQLHAGGDHLGLWLAGAGLARVAPGADDPCGRILLLAEAKARQAKLGLWADPYYSVLAAENVVALRSHSGE